MNNQTLASEIIADLRDMLEEEIESLAVIEKEVRGLVKLLSCQRIALQSKLDQLENGEESKRTEIKDDGMCGDMKLHRKEDVTKIMGKTEMQEDEQGKKEEYRNLIVRMVNQIDNERDLEQILHLYIEGLSGGRCQQMNYKKKIHDLLKKANPKQLERLFYFIQAFLS